MGAKFSHQIRGNKLFSTFFQFSLLGACFIYEGCVYLYHNIETTTKTRKIMATVTQNNGLKVEFNGKKTYFVTDSNGDCWGYFDTERKAKNAMKRILKEQGLA